MTQTLSDMLLRESSAERSEAFFIDFAGGGQLRVPASRNAVGYLVLEGQVTLRAGGMEGPVTLRAGEFALLFYGTAHTAWAGVAGPLREEMVVAQWPDSDEPQHLRIGTGKVVTQCRAAQLQILHMPIRPHQYNPMPEVMHLRRENGAIFNERVLTMDRREILAACRGPGASAFVTAILNLHLIHAFRCVSIGLKRAFPEMAEAPSVIRSEKNRAVAIAVRLLRAHPERRWTVALLARELGQSRSTFAATFRTCIGTGPIEYQMKVRMEQAAALLAEPNLTLPLISIAHRVGYADASSFARAFKLHFGCSPRSFGARSRATAH